MQRFNSILSSAAHCSGEGFYYLKGEAAVLELALVQYAMSKAIKKVSFSEIPYSGEFWRELNLAKLAS